MIDYKHVKDAKTFYLADCLGKDCPLCKAGFEIKPKLIAEDIKTGKKYTLSSSLSEKIKKIMDKSKK